VLEVTDLESGYGALQVIWGVSFYVADGEFVSLVGPNGAGKSTTLRTIVNLVKPKGGKVVFMGQDISGASVPQAVAHGISFIPETLNLFPRMTVEENLIMGAFRLRDRKRINDLRDKVLHLFPRLGERRKQLAGTLSGGELKMLAIGRGLMADPKILLVDEPSLGLAPMLVVHVFRALEELHRAGVSILLVEQNVNSVLHMTDRTYVLERGRIVLEGKSSDLIANEHIRSVYLGL